MVDSGALSNFSSEGWPLCLSAASYGTLALLNIWLLEESMFNLLLIAEFRFFRTWGGWFDLVLMYSGVSFGFL